MIGDPLSRRQFLQQTAKGVAGVSTMGLTASPAPAADAGSFASPGDGSVIAQAQRHPIVRDIPASYFMEGSILGNGALGAVVTPLPDAVMIYIGHNAVWDQRMAPLDTAKLGTFADALQHIKALSQTIGDLSDNPQSKQLSSDPWFNAYQALGKESYHKTYPRPLSCGAVVLGFDRREAEVLAHRVLIDRGLCQIDFLVGGERRMLEVFADMSTDQLWARMVDASNNPAPSPIKYVGILPDLATPKEFPLATSQVLPATSALGLRQVMPYDEITDAQPYHSNPKDRAFSLEVRVSSPFESKAKLPKGVKSRIVSWIKPADSFSLVIALRQGDASAISLDAGALPAPNGHAAAARASTDAWHTYWEKSGVALDDLLLEQTWYWNMYFLRCALNEKTVAPGCYAICPYPNQPTPWHGDYHMDYNCEQAFWSTFSTNHPELNLPYVDLVHHMLPVARSWTQQYYGMRGACFPISSYPVDLRSYPYAAPVFAWMVCVTPWTVQGLWWHYLYTKDLDYLRDRGFEPIKAAVQFLIDYIKRPDVYTPPWPDKDVHVFPTFPPELYGLLPGLPRDFNSDTITDLAMIRFIFRAYLEACQALGIEAAEAQDIRDVKDILSRLPPYPTTQSPRGEIYVTVRGEDDDKVYNAPISLMPVFPGEDLGLHSTPEEFSIATATYWNQQNEGGNEIVFLNLQAARLGLLDLEKFKREILYTQLPNGTCADVNLQVGGRFSFQPREYDWMTSYGIWFENFSLPVVLNECMLQSYTGELRFFPNWPKDKRAEFKSLRAAGAFLVSAQFHSGLMQWAEIMSEKGGALNILAPWKQGAVWIRNGQRTTVTDSRISISTQPGDRIRLMPA